MGPIDFEEEMESREKESGSLFHFVSHFNLESGKNSGIGLKTRLKQERLSTSHLDFF